MPNQDAICPSEKKIWFILSDCGLGGTQKFALSLAADLSQRGYSISFFLLNPNAEIALSIPPEITVERFTRFGRFDKILAIRRLMVGENKALFFSFLTDTNIMVGLCLLFSSSVKAYAFERNVIVYSSWYKAFLHRLAIPLFRSHLTNSEESYAYLTRHNGRVRRLYNYVENYQSLNASSISSRDIDVLYLGSFTQKKQVKTIARIFCALPRSRNAWMVGDGPLFHDVCQIVLETNSPNVVISKSRPSRTLMNRAKVVLLLSEREGIPNVFLEACQSGCLFFSNRSSKLLTQYVFDSGGIICNSEESQVILEMLELAVDTYQLDRVKKNNTIFLQKYLSVIDNQLEEFMEEIAQYEE